MPVDSVATVGIEADGNCICETLSKNLEPKLNNVEAEFEFFTGATLSPNLNVGGATLNSFALLAPSNVKN